jgi:glucose-6-phosphate 1-dehydrogenase
MSDTPSDALVFFGATGDLAYKKIFPALQAMVRRGHLRVPVIGVARADWTLEQLKARARDSVEKHGGLDPAAFAKPKTWRPREADEKVAPVGGWHNPTVTG